MNEELFTTVYNPDVLSCIANLSSDEVFTPPGVANDVLDMLPQELFQSRETTFLDPASKSGIFLREIAKRLLRAQVPGYEQTAHEIQKKQKEGAALEQDDESFLAVLQENIDHIFHKQLFGIANTELTSLLSRRSVYCSKFPNSEFSISRFDSVEGNIRFRRTPHSWDKGGNCRFCGASKNVFDRGDKLEAHAYEFIHTDHPERIFDMKFDVIISNPPYQLTTGGGTDEKKSATQARPIYPMFIEQAKKLNPRYLCMIVPARWYSGGMGLNQFRAEMLKDKHITTLVDYINSKDCFQGVDIAGGVCYFLWDRDHSSETCHITNISGNDVTTSERPLDEFETLFIRSNNAIEIIKKVQQKTPRFMTEIVSSIDTFGIPSKEKGHEVKEDGDISLLHTKGYNGQGVSYISKDTVKKNHHLIDKYKVKISIMVPQGGEVGIRPENGYRSISTPQILPPGQVDSFSYLNVGFFDTEEEAKHLVQFLCCKLTRYLLRATYSSVHVSRENFSFVPLVDFAEEWSDEKLYAHFGLSEKEIELVEKTMRPMDLSAEGAADD